MPVRLGGPPCDERRFLIYFRLFVMSVMSGNRWNSLRKIPGCNVARRYVANPWLRIYAGVRIHFRTFFALLLTHPCYRYNCLSFLFQFHFRFSFKIFRVLVISNNANDVHVAPVAPSSRA